MRAAICAIVLLCPVIGWADETKATVTGRQGNRPVSFGGGLETFYEGLVVALLGNCHSESGPTVATEEKWEAALKGNHLLVTFAKPRRFGLTAGEPPEVEADEILVPISIADIPKQILVRSGKTYRAFSKYEHTMCTFIQDSLKSLPAR